MTAAEIDAFMDQVFPQARALGWTIDEVGDRRAVVRLPVGEHHLRPGDTVSGPTLMTLADTAMFFAVLATVGPVALAVTTHLGMDFLRRAGGGELVARADILKLGRRLAVGHVVIHADGEPEPVAQASVTYALPPG